jgi:hypothetical protein
MIARLAAMTMATATARQSARTAWAAVLIGAAALCGCVAAPVNPSGSGPIAGVSAGASASAAAIDSASPAATGPAPTPSSGASVQTVVVAGRVVAGPTCPVVRAGASGCGDRPVAGARVAVTTQAGAAVMTIESDPAGRFSMALEPGSYTLTPQPMAGLMGTAPVQALSVRAGEPISDLLIAYDTGIR